MAKYSVKKANQLVKIEEKMSKSAQLWVSYLVACLPKAKAGVDDFPTLQFTFKEIKQAINADGKKRIAKVDDVFKIGKELLKTPLWYENENRRGYVAWLTEVSEDKQSDNQVFNFVFHPKLKPYLLNLESQYTIYNYFYRVCLSNNSMKVYEILKSYQYLGEITLNIEKGIKEPLGLLGKYDKYYDFRRKVIDVAQRELTKFTDIRFDYEVAEKKWNRAISLTFVISKNIPTELPEPLVDFVKTSKSLPKISTVIPIDEVSQKTDLPTAYPELFAILTNLGGKKGSIEALITKYGIEAVEYQTTHVRRKLKESNKIKNAFAWLIKALEAGYVDPVQAAKEKNRNRILKQQKKQSRQKDREETLKHLKSEQYQAEKMLTAQLFEEAPLLLSQILMELKEDSKTVRSELQKGNSPEAIFQNVRTQGFIINAVKSHFPEKFQAIEKSFSQKIETLDK